VIACGEIGLDYYHGGAAHTVQREWLIRQLEIAAGRQRPILIHCRPKDDMTEGSGGAWGDLFEILESHWRQTGLRGVMHCFGGGWEQALDGVLVETDAPWLTPTPDRGKRNEPAFVTRTAQTLAGLLGVSGEEIAASTTKNFNRLFGLRADVGN
jgi:TatD DNase family protein